MLLKRGVGGKGKKRDWVGGETCLKMIGKLTKWVATNLLLHFCAKGADKLMIEVESVEKLEDIFSRFYFVWLSAPSDRYRDFLGQLSSKNSVCCMHSIAQESGLQLSDIRTIENWDPHSGKNTVLKTSTWLKNKIAYLTFKNVRAQKLLILSTFWNFNVCQL